MRIDESGSIHPRLVIGILIMVLGTMFLLENLDVMDLELVARFWPLFFVAIGATIAAQPSGTTNRGFGVFLVAAGLWVLLHDFGVIGLSFWDGWPVFLIGFGAWLIWRRAGGPAAVSTAAGMVAEPGAGGRNVTDDDTVSIFAFLNGIERASNSKSFRGGELTAIMGGCDIDLRDAKIGADPPIIDAFAFWGGIEIHVPEDWVVENKVMPLLGGLDDKTRSTTVGSSKQLLVRGSAIMGGVTITN